MAKVEIYTQWGCPYCVSAKALLTRKGVEFTEYDITMGGPKREEMIARVPGARTVPQILIDDVPVGAATISTRWTVRANSTRCWVFKR